ncbi:glycosyltransferase family 2 protein [uncultured Jatrophihabitans sp.]|uniref:glycosyltransferase family 2 protein n=1 Tax=uncultured Jatrophihabitans sp. TaxID=1610747 RepID=UPI0035CAD450
MSDARSPADNRCRVDVVLPCLDEAAALPWVLERLPDGARALVVDNGSADGSPALAAELGATVVPCAVQGYGAACHAGLEAATADVVAVCDCDGSLDPRDVLALLAVLDRGADLVIGRRRPTGREAWSWSSRVANRELARRIRRRTGLRIDDVGPLRVARREALLSLGLTDRRSGYPAETVVRAADAGWRIEQVDVAYGPRIGRSKVTGTLRGTVQAVRDMSAAITA